MSKRVSVTSDDGRQRKYRVTETVTEKLIECVSIEKLQPRMSKRFRRHEIPLRIKLRHNLSALNGLEIFSVQQQLDDAWREILDTAITDADDDDIIATYIEHPDGGQDIWIPYRKKSAIKYDEFLNAIGKHIRNNYKIYSEFRRNRMSIKQTILAQL